jgi:type 1 glutamine amidotransferase
MKRRILALIVVAMTSIAPAAEPKAKVLLIGKDRDHPFQTHEYMAECELLARCLRQTPCVEALVSNGWPADPKTLDGVTTIVFYTQKGGNVLFADAARRQAEKLLKKGVGLVAIHWGTGADKPTGDPWLKALGGWFESPKPSRVIFRSPMLRQAEPQHPICRGWKDRDQRDEYYLDLHFDPRAKPVINVTIDGKEYPVAWVFERSDGGRSFAYLGGHFHANFGKEQFRKPLVNGILWTARLDVPPDGAPCAVTAKDMELPPDTRPMKK